MGSQSDYWWLIGLVILGAVVGAISYSGPTPPDGVIPPVVDAGDDIRALAGTDVRLMGTAYDTSGARFGVVWSSPDGYGGQLDPPDALRPVFHVPSICGETTLELMLTATNEHGATASDRLLLYVCETSIGLPEGRRTSEIPSRAGITVIPGIGDEPCEQTCVPINHPPYADAGSDITLREGETTQLTCEGGDPDGDAVSYRWSADAGTFADPTMLHPMYTAPSVGCGAPTCVKVTLTVTDSYGASRSDDMLVTVTNENRAPHADAGGDITLREGETARLTCEGSDPDGDAVSYRWSADAGTFADPTMLHPMYTAPSVDCGAPTCVRVTLTVTDSCGASSSDDMLVTVIDANHPPIAYAGEDFAMSECLPILLSGNAEDPDGDVDSVQWEIVCGGGHLDFPDQLDAIYLAPAVSACCGSDVIPVSYTHLTLPTN